MENTIEHWNKKKRHLMKVLRYARTIKSKTGIETYSNAVDRCDVKIGVISAMQRMMVIIILACLILAIGGCGTLAGLQSDIHQVTRPTTMERGQ